MEIAEENDRTAKGGSSLVWALRDINFDVKHGEVLGIIGRNGAGKSTLLKILSRTTAPTTGKVKIKGRVASLLEVGTGFHPELSGRENIFLNGAILGMTKREIRGKFEEIVDFAGVERYIDTPVKRYSSGMYVRLAFAVAAHLEPEILVVDEVLAVGDAEFQKKALGKMKDVSTNEGRTVLFVSHNTRAIRALCSKALLLTNGKVDSFGDVDTITENHFRTESKPALEFVWENVNATHGIFLKKIFIEDDNNNRLNQVTTDQEFKITVEYEVQEKSAKFGFTVGFWNEYDELIFLTLSNLDADFFRAKTKGVYTSSCTIPGGLLNDQCYRISFNVFDANYSNGITFKDVLTIAVNDGSQLRKDYVGKYQGVLRPAIAWSTQKRPKEESKILIDVPKLDQQFG